MTFKNFMYKGVLMITVLALIGWLGKYLYLVDGEIDWFRLMLVYGVPVGIPYMFFIIPWHWDLSGILGMMALCVIVGSLFGSFIAIWLLVRAVGYVIGYLFSFLINKNRMYGKIMKIRKSGYGYE